MPSALKFSDFVLDSRRYELRRGEQRLKLEKIPMELLILLVEREGELVSRDEIVERLWGKEVFIEADRGINTAISKLRVALRDDPERPRYIQTVVGKGYRFIASISRAQSPQTLAVLPFKPLSRGDSDEYLELGMADALITKLSRSGRLIVRPTSAIRKYAGDDCDVLAAGRELQVDAVLEGNIQHLGPHLRVSIRLIRVRDGTSLWSESYDAPFTDVFQVQDTVSERVVDTLAVQLSNLEKASLRKHYTADVPAYELYMRGIFFWNKRNEDGLRKAVSNFERAIVLDENYALAHAGLAAALCPLGYLGYSASQEVRPKLRAAATQAANLDPSLPEAHVALAAGLAFYEWDWLKAEREFQRALELNPNLPLAHHWYALLLECLGRYHDALQHRQRARELDPITPIIVCAVGQTLFLLGEGERALEEFHKALELDNSLDQAHVGIGQVYEQRGEYDRAIPEYRLAVQYSSGSRLAKAALGHALAQSGATSESKQILDELAAPHARHLSAFYPAIICVGLGDHETALDWLEKAHERRDSTLSRILMEPGLQAVRMHPRSKALLRKMGLAETAKD
jgi:TolB-like protein/tetratricopeptide (TPR) repeat protein